MDRLSFRSVVTAGKIGEPIEDIPAELFIRLFFLMPLLFQKFLTVDCSDPGEFRKWTLVIVNKYIESH